MARRLLTDRLVSREQIGEEIKPIPGFENSWCTRSGRIFVEYEPELFFEKALTKNGTHGYLQVGLIKEGASKNTTCRAHRLIALTWVPNPDPVKYKIVGHKDNDKANLAADNLYWTDTAENTQKAYNDGLAHNKSGFDDEQSMPVVQFDLDFNVIETFGSVSLAAKATGFTKRGITFQCHHEMKTKPRKGFYFRFLSEYQEKGFVL